MIIKNDFVTNSSSTIWIVYIPSNYSIDIDAFMEQLLEDYEEIELTDLMVENELSESLDLLKSGESVWSYHVDGLHFAIYDTLITFLSDHGHTIKAFDVSSEGSNMIVGLSSDEAKAAFLKSIDIDETFKLLTKGESDEEIK